MTEKKNWKRSTSIKYIVLFLVLCIFFYFVPYTDDDLRWGSQVGMKRLNNGFAGYGGRYLGYLIVMGLTRSVVLKVLFMSAIVVLLAFLVRYITNLQTAPYIVIASVMAAPLSLFSATMGWVSGFANYVTSVCFTLIYIAYVVSFEKQETKKSSIIMTILLCLLGLMNALVVEHFTIYNVLLGIMVVIFFTVKCKCVFIQFIGYMIGTVAGAYWMFSNSAYHKVLAGNDNYRDIGNGGILKTIAYGMTKICKYGYMDNLYLNIVILIALCLVVWKYRSHLDAKRQLWVKGCLAVNLAFVIASCLFPKLYEGTLKVGTAVNFAMSAISLIGISALFMIALLFAKYDRCFQMILFLLVSIVILDAPFLVVNPVTPRVFFGTYILFTMIFCILVRELCCEMHLLSENRIAKVVKLGVILGACFYIAVFSTIWKADRDRLKSIRMQAEDGKKTIVMTHVPYEQFVHNITLNEKWQFKGYKQFYELPKNLKFTVEEDDE